MGHCPHADIKLALAREQQRPLDVFLVRVRVSRVRGSRVRGRIRGRVRVIVRVRVKVRVIRVRRSLPV